MDHADIIAAADAEAQRQGFELVAIHAVPAMGPRLHYALPMGRTPGPCIGLARQTAALTLVATIPAGSAPSLNSASAWRIY